MRGMLWETHYTCTECMPGFYLQMGADSCIDRCPSGYSKNGTLCSISVFELTVIFDNLFDIEIENNGV